MISTKLTWLYAFPGFALAFAALPLYILTPSLYAGTLGLPLAAVGFILMLSRLVDAFTDPIFGRLIDKTDGHRFKRWMVPSLCVLVVSFAALMLPPTAWLSPESTGLLLSWMGVAAVFVSLSNSAALLAHQSWAIAQFSDLTKQTRWVGARETTGLIGVIIAAALAAQSMSIFMVTLLTVTAILSIWAISYVSRILPVKSVDPQNSSIPGALGGLVAWKQIFQKDFRLLLAALGVNALANAIPATLFLFFVSDHLKISERWAAGLLVIYFLCAAASIALWMKACHRFGPRRTWQSAMILAIAAFIWAVFLKPGDIVAFGLICIATGIALGAELTCPSFLIGQVIVSQGHQNQAEAQYFSIWGLLNKLALAVSAGLVLPLLQVLGYKPGIDASGALALQLTYAGIPCLFKSIALIILPASPIAKPFTITTSP